MDMEDQAERSPNPSSSQQDDSIRERESSPDQRSRSTIEDGGRSPNPASIQPDNRVRERGPDRRSMRRIRRGDGGRRRDHSSSDPNNPYPSSSQQDNSIRERENSPDQRSRSRIEDGGRSPNPASIQPDNRVRERGPDRRSMRRIRRGDGGTRRDHSSSDPNNRVDYTEEHVFYHDIEEIPSRPQNIAIVEALLVGQENPPATEETVNDTANSGQHARVNQMRLWSDLEEDMERSGLITVPHLATEESSDRPPAQVDPQHIERILRCVRDRLSAYLEGRPIHRSNLDTAIEFHCVRILPTIRISENHINSDNGITSSCPICHFDFELGAKVTPLKCRHHYHPYCIARWLSTGNSCPVCRLKVEFVFRVNLRQA